MSAALPPKPSGTVSSFHRNLIRTYGVRKAKNVLNKTRRNSANSTGKPPLPVKVKRNVSKGIAVKSRRGITQRRRR